MPYVSEINGVAVRKDSLRTGLVHTESGVQRTGSFSIRVIADDFTQTDLDILLLTSFDDGTPIPLMYSRISFSFVVGIEFSRTLTHHRDTNNETYAWLLEYTLDSDVDINNAPRNDDGTLDTTGGVGNPLNLPADFDVDAEIEYIPLDRPERDANGRRFQNRFGQSLGRFVTGFEAERAVNVVRIQRWGVWPTPLTQLNFYNNTVNADVFHGIPIGCAWMQVKSKKTWYHGIEYARESYVIRVLIDSENPATENTWGEINIKHMSDRYILQVNGGEIITSLTDEGYTGPYWLNADGSVHQDSDPDSEGEFLTFSAKRAVPWAPLNLPNR